MKLNKEQKKMEKELNKKTLRFYISVALTIIGVIYFVKGLFNEVLNANYLFGVILILAALHFSDAEDIDNLQRYIIKRNMKGGLNGRNKKYTFSTEG